MVSFSRYMYMFNLKKVINTNSTYFENLIMQNKIFLPHHFFFKLSFAINIVIVSYHPKHIYSCVQKRWRVENRREASDGGRRKRSHRAGLEAEEARRWSRENQDGHWRARAGTRKVSKCVNYEFTALLILFIHFLYINLKYFSA